MDENFPERRSLGVRLCGEDAYWGELPVDTSQLTDIGKSITPGEKQMEPGEPMRGAQLA